MKKPFRSVYFWYTILFCAAAGLVFIPFLISGKSFVYSVDGGSQYIVYLRYMGEYLRNALSRLLNGTLTPVMYDFSIGMGDDINAIVRFHPLDFLSVFVPAEKTELLYHVILLLRYYLAGLAFCIFAMSWKKGHIGSAESLPFEIAPVNVLSGAMLYVFSGYMLLRCMNHPTYVSAFIILPLLLLAAERVMEGRGLILFPAVCALGFISNYYFMYICSIALAIYMLLRMKDYLQEKGTGVRGFFALFFRCVGLYLIGLGISCITLLPTLLRYADSYRTSQTSTRGNLLFYADPRRYAAWFVNLISPYVSSGNGTNLNFAVVAFPALVLLFFCCRKKLRTVKKILVIELICLLVPAAGFVMAAFNNENNRWMFLIALALGMTVVFLADGFYDMSSKTARILAAACAVFCAAAIVSAFLIGYRAFYLSAVGQLVVCTAVLVFFGRKKKSLKAVRSAVLVCAVCSVILNAWFTFLPQFGNAMADTENAGKAYRRYRRDVRSALLQIPDDSFWRADASGIRSGNENTAIYYGLRGVSIYNSIVNPNLIDAMMLQDNIGLDAVTHLQDLDGRMIAEALAGVKYYATKEDGIVPTGFSQTPAAGGTRKKIYVNENVLPFGYTYDHVIARTALQEDEPICAETVMLDAAVLEADDLVFADGITGISQGEVEVLSDAAVLPQFGEHVQLTQNGYEVLEKNGSVAIPYQKKPGYSCILSLKGFTADGQSNLIKIVSGGMTKQILLRGPEQTYTLGREDYLIDLMAQSEGTYEGETAEVKIVFVQKGIYRIKEARFLYLPIAEIVQKLSVRGSESMTDVIFTENCVTGNADLTAKKFMVFPILYSGGWKLTVDGEEVPLLKANVSYMGAVIDAGKHRLELSYETPGLRAGAWISLGAIAVWLVLLIVGKAGKKRKMRQGKIIANLDE